ncbi:MAG: YbgC/FadM family acyl-CoA thioesterase [Sphingomonadaceae bacterium]
MTQPRPPLQPQGGLIEGSRHFFAVRAYYEDTDLSGIVYHANYLRWFERARSDLVRMIGVDQRAAIEAGEGAFAVAGMDLEFRRPARLDDDIVIETLCTDVRAASCRMHQFARRGDELLVEARLRVGFIDPAGRPRRMSATWHKAFSEFMGVSKTT